MKKVNKETYEQNDDGGIYLGNEGKQFKFSSCPREVRISGKISRLFIGGVDKQQHLKYEQYHADASHDSSKPKTKNYVIIPIRERGSQIQFVKVPLYKLSKNPEAKRLGDTRCRKLNRFEEETVTEELAKWSADKREIRDWKEFSSGRGPGTEKPSELPNSHCVWRQEESQLKKPFEPQEVTKTTSEEKPKFLRGEEAEWGDPKAQEPLVAKRENRSEENWETSPPSMKHMPNHSGARNSPRVLKYLVTLEGKSRFKNRFNNSSI